MDQIIVKLKQHTPLLHFQPKQENATLRASEVKPMLSKYLFGEGEPHPFKMRIQSGSPVKLAMIEADMHRTNPYGVPLFKTFDFPKKGMTLVLGNMGGRPQDHLLNLVFYRDVVVTILCDPADSALLVSKIPVFFDRHLFGNRKSKGFGSFSVAAMELNGEKVAVNRDPADDDPVVFVGELDDVLFIPDRQTSPAMNYRTFFQEVFGQIHTYWGALKREMRQGKKNGKDLRNVLLGHTRGDSVQLGRTVRIPLSQDSSKRIPSPFTFKPYWWVRRKTEDDGSESVTWVNRTSIYLNPDVIRQVAAMSNVAVKTVVDYYFYLFDHFSFEA